MREEDKELLSMNEYEFIRIGHRVYGKSISELARITGRSRNTVKKAIRGEPWGYKERKHQAFPVLGPYMETIDKWLEEDRSQPKKQRHTARRIYNRLVEEYGFKGSESTVRRYVRMAKIKLGLEEPEVFVPCDPEAGVEAEVDWGSATAIIAGEKVRLKFFCMRSKYSGKHFVRFYPCERQEAFFDAHIHAFNFFGGVFPVIIYDNLTSAVKKVLSGKSRIEQESFRKFRSYYSFEARFCNSNSAHEKGGVEGLVGFARRNYMVPVPEAESIEALNEVILKRCYTYGNHTICGRDATVNELYEREKKHLLELPEIAFSNIKVSSGRVDKYSTVIVDQNRYSVPTRYAGFKVNIVMSVERIEIFSGNKKIATHERRFGKNKWCLKPEHYLSLLLRRPGAFESARPIREWRKSWPKVFNELLERFRNEHGETKGIKEFISVLMLYKDYSWEDIESAVELALESNIGSSEGVKHILVFMKEPREEVLPLADWLRLPPPDISVYGQLEVCNE